MELLLSITIFVVFGAAFVFINLAVGALARPKIPNPEKAAVYECGEPSIGSSWVQFDLRFYIVALVYLIFDVEVALFYPWAVAYGSAADLGRQIGMTVSEPISRALYSETPATTSATAANSGSCLRPSAQTTAACGSWSQNQRAGVMLCEMSSLRLGSSSTARSFGA